MKSKAVIRMNEMHTVFPKCGIHLSKARRHLGKITASVSLRTSFKWDLRKKACLDRNTRYIATVIIIEEILVHSGIHAVALAYRGTRVLDLYPEVESLEDTFSKS